MKKAKFARRMLFAVMMLGLVAGSAFAQEPSTSTEYIAAGNDLIVLFGLSAVIVATAVVGLGTFILRKVRAGVR